MTILNHKPEAFAPTPSEVAGFQQAAEIDRAIAQPSRIELRKLYNMGRRRLGTILGVLVIGTLLTLVFALQLPSRYTARSTILVDARQTNVIDTQAVLSGLGRDTAAVESEARLIKSTSVAARVIDHLGLLDAPAEEKPSIFGAILTQLFGGKEEALGGLDRQARKDALATQLATRVQVARQSLTYIINVSYTDTNPGMAARIANGFADAYLVDQLEAKFEATQRANDWLNDRVADLRDKVQAADRAVEDFRVTHNLMDGGAGTTLTDQQVAKINADLIAARSTAAAAKTKLDQLNLAISQGKDVNSFAAPAEATNIAALQSKMSDLRRQDTELATRYAARHPSVVAVRAQIADVQAQLAAEVNKIKSATENEWRIAESQQRSIEGSLASFRGDAANSIVLIGLILSAAAGIGLAYVLELISNGFVVSEQVELALGAPLLASIPVADGSPEGKSGLGRLLRPLRALLPERMRGPSRAEKRATRGAYWHVVEKPLSQFTESIRSLRMGLRYAGLDKPLKTILVTSSLPSEGKSTIASNLALHAAASGEKVLLIDLDLRHPTLTGLYTPDSKAGIVDVLTGSARLAAVSITDEKTGLQFLPASRNIPAANTAEILGSAKVRELIASCRERYDLVIIDCPPLLPVVDSRALISSVDAVVLAIRWEKTSIEAVKSAIRQTFGLSSKLVGAVLSQVEMKKARYYNYYESGYYSKKYPYYYGET